MEAFDTKEYIKKHIERVRKHIFTFVLLLEMRGQKHDASKLKEPELTWWKKMDEEPRYPYGSPEYNDKMRRWRIVFDHHYKCNRHHPEHFEFGIMGMNLVDIIEMLCDWIGYRDSISITEAVNTVENQMRRYGISEDLACVIKNTLFDYFSIIGGASQGDLIPAGIEMELGPHQERVKETLNKEYHHIDIYA